jgi:glutathione peroxidase
MRSFLCGLAVVLTLTLASMNLSADPATSLYDLKVNSLDGKPVDLAQYKGKVVLVVNVASRCGFTPQYTGLEALYQSYKDKGFELLAFPANDFKNQEPGTSQEILAFCHGGKYNVTFPMFEKSVTKGPNQSPVYQYLTSTKLSAPTWNFCKYLVDKNGKVLQFFPSKVTPEDPTLHQAIDAALKG